ncbi:transcriptional regulator family: Fungal Specific TF [Paecilomyces variotii]|nr:transcriptional regulator family: Fungal Specific TF [Paecilomyces variotii]
MVMDALKSKPLSSSSHGSGPRGPRACRICAVAKARCVPSAVDGTKCERCHRLKKECVMQTPSATRRRKAPRTRVAQLEQKLDNIVTLLTSNRTTPADEEQVQDRADPSYTGIPAAASSNTQSGSASSIPDATAACLQPASLSRSPDPGPPHQFYGSAPLPPPPVELNEETCLNLFRMRMAEHFPFVMIDSKVSVHELRRDKPFLLKAIVVTASFSQMERQMNLGKEFVQELSQRMLVEGEKSLDLLQGLLVYMGWFQYLFSSIRQITNLLQLAVALVVDLGLNKGQSKPNVQCRFQKVSDAMGDVSGLGSSGGSGTLEERRAFLGCFYLTAVVSSVFRRMDPLRYTPYVEECCQILLSSKRYPTDTYLVELVRLQKIANTIKRSIPIDDIEPGKMRAPVGMHMKAIEKDLHVLRESWNKLVKGNCILNIHYHDTEMSLYEIVFYDIPPQTSYGSYSFERLNTLYACLESSLALIEQFLSIPPAIYVYVPIVIWLHIARAIIFTRRLCFLENSEWDLNYVRSRVNLPTILDKMIQKSELARSSMLQPELGEHRDLLLVSITKLRMVKEGYLRAIASEQETVGSLGHNISSSSVPAGYYDFDMSEGFLGIYDSFWQGFPEGWNICK